MDDLLNRNYPGCDVGYRELAQGTYRVGEFGGPVEKETRLYYCVFSVYGLVEHYLPEFDKTRDEFHWTNRRSTLGSFVCKATYLAPAEVQRDQVCIGKRIQYKYQTMTVRIDNCEVVSPDQTLPFLCPWINYAAWMRTEKKADLEQPDTVFTLVRWITFRYNCDEQHTHMKTKTFVGQMLSSIRATFPALRSDITNADAKALYDTYHAPAELETGITQLTPDAYEVFKAAVRSAPAVKNSGLLRRVLPHMARVVSGGWASRIIKDAAILNWFKFSDENNGGGLWLEGLCMLIAAAMNYRVTPDEPVLNAYVIPRKIRMNLLLFVPECFLDASLWSAVLYFVSKEARHSLSRVRPANRTQARSDVLLMTSRICALNHDLDRYRQSFRSTFYGFIVRSDTPLLDDGRRFRAELVSMREWRDSAFAIVRGGFQRATSLTAPTHRSLAPLKIPPERLTTFQLMRVLSIERGPSFTYESDPVSKIESRNLMLGGGGGGGDRTLVCRMTAAGMVMAEELLLLLNECHVHVVQCTSSHDILGIKDMVSAVDVGMSVCIVPSFAHKYMLHRMWCVDVFTVEELVKKKHGSDVVHALASTKPVLMLYAHMIGMAETAQIMSLAISASSALGKRHASDDVSFVRNFYMVGLERFLSDRDDGFVDVFHQLSTLGGVHPNVVCSTFLQPTSTIDNVRDLQHYIRTEQNMNALSIMSILKQCDCVRFESRSTGKPVDQCQWDGFDLIFGNYLTFENLQLIRGWAKECDYYVFASDRYGLPLQFSRLMVAGGSSTPRTVCFCGFTDTSIFGAAMRDFACGELFLVENIEDAIFEGLPHVHCAKCVSAMRAYHSGVGPTPLALDMSRMDARLLYHPKYASFVSPRRYVGVAVASVTLVVNDRLAYEDLMAALDVCSQQLTVRFVGMSDNITRVNWQYEPDNGNWLLSIMREMDLAKARADHGDLDESDVFGFASKRVRSEFPFEESGNFKT